MAKSILSPELEKEILVGLKDPSMSYSDIAGALGLEYIQVYNVNLKHGIRPVYSRAGKATARPAAPVLVIGLTEYEKAQQELKALDEKRAQILKHIAELEIRFEREDKNVLVYGLAESPLKADYRQWLRFLRTNKAAELREFINRKFGTRP